MTQLSTPSFIIYMAGVLDSDGSFTYGKKWSSQRGKHYYAAQIQITWAYTPNAIKVFDRLIKIFGGSYFIGGTRTTFTPDGIKIVKYCATGAAAVRLSAAVMPFLQLKTERAKIIVEGAKLKSSFWGPVGKPEEIWKKKKNFIKK